MVKIGETMEQWIDKDERIHRIEYMTDRYLINCIQYNKKCIKSNPDYIIPPIYYNLLYEHNKRIEINE